MRYQSTASASDGTMSYEFVPPPDMPESWGVPWDRQVEAAMAWQAAHAAAERRAGVADSAAARTGNVHQPGAPTMLTLSRVTIQLNALRERLKQLQGEAANIAIAEMARRRDADPADDASNGDVPLHGDTAERMAELTRTWFALMADAQHEMRALVGLSAGSPFIERRRRPQVIDFPDRRAA